MDFSKVELNETAKLAADGNVEAIEYIVNSFGGVIKAKAKSYHINGIESEDLVQEGMIGLIKAIRTYSDDRNASFRTFAELCVTRSILSAVKAACAKKNIPLNSYVSIYREINDPEGAEHYLIDELNDENGKDPIEDIIRREEINETSRRLTKELSDFEMLVLSKYMEGKNYRQIAEETGRTPKSIDNAIQRIKQKAAQAALGNNEEEQ